MQSIHLNPGLSNCDSRRARPPGLRLYRLLDIGITVTLFLFFRAPFVCRFRIDLAANTVLAPSLFNSASAVI